MSKPEERISESLFGPPQGQQAGESKPRCSCRIVWKVAVVVALGVVVLAVIMSKARRKESSAAGPMTGGGVGRKETAAEPAPETVLATVNGREITLGELARSLDELPPQYRAAFEGARHEYLEELITRKLLLQEARRLQAADVPSQPGDGSQVAASSTEDEQALIEALVRRAVVEKTQVSEADVRAFYDEYGTTVCGIPQGKSFEEVKDALRPYVQQEKLQKAFGSYLAELRAKATITRDETWIEQQKAMAADNPLDRALKTGRPVVADFGRGTCTPCKMMKPILDDLKKRYERKAEVLIISVDEHPAITSRCGIGMIPTQIFYDASGKEVTRHMGFMPREDIVKQLQAMGVK